MPDPTGTRPLPHRGHPHRLNPDMYRLVGWPVFSTFRARPGANLCQNGSAEAVATAMGRMGWRQKVRINAFCIMPDHVHAVVSVAEAGGDIEKWIRYVKRETSKLLRRPGMWQRSYWDTHAREDEDLVAAVDYILDNPVRKGLCGVWRDWSYSWSQWHPEGRGPDPNQAG
jgi:REP element-mobilizing transposase RayT